MKRNISFLIAMALFCLHAVLFSSVIHFVSNTDQPAQTDIHPKHDMLAFKEIQLTKATSEAPISHVIRSNFAVDFDHDMISRSGSESNQDASVEAKRDEAIKPEPANTTAEMTLASEQVKPGLTRLYIEPIF